MILTELTSVSVAALPIAQFKAHLRLGTGFADSDIQDELLGAYLRAAISTVEVMADAADFRFVPDDICAAVEATAQALPKLPIGGTVEVVFDAGFGSDRAVPCVTCAAGDVVMGGGCIKSAVDAGSGVTSP